MSDIVEKLRNLVRLEDVALFRWSSTAKRVGGGYIPLSELRLNIVSCNAGVVHFSMAAPVLHLAHGRPKITLHDSDLFRIVNGPRKNINVRHQWLKRDEEAIEVGNIMHCDCTDGNITKMVANKVMSLGTARSYPVMRIVLPDTYRLTTDLAHLRPIYTRQLMEVIGGSDKDTAETLKRKFTDNIRQFGYETADGYVVSASCIAAGGMLCVTGEGISRSSGGAVFQAPLGMLKEQARTSGWNIHFEEGSENELARETDAVEHAAAGDAGDGDDRA